MSAFPSLPLFTDAFIADTGHLSAQETGAFLMLLMMAWRSPNCCLPDDDDRLARWARVDRRTWLKIKPTVMEFWTLSDGFWLQKRLTKERGIVSKRAEVARENGQQGGRPKSLKINEAENPVGSLRVSQEKAPNPNPITPSLRSGDDGARSARASGRGTRIPEDWKPTEDDNRYARELGFGDADLSEALLEFRNYWGAESGQRARKVDWSLTWRNRLKDALHRRRHRPSSPANGVRDGPVSRPVRVDNRMTAVNEILDFVRDQPPR